MVSLPSGQLQKLIESIDSKARSKNHPTDIVEHEFFFAKEIAQAKSITERKNSFYGIHHYAVCSSFGAFCS